MNTKKILPLLMLAFLITIVSASTLDQYNPQKVDEEFNFTQNCYEATYITISTIVTPNSTETINTNMTSTGEGSFEYNYTPNQIGEYDFVGISDGCSKTFRIYVPVTADGNVYDTGDSLIRIFVAIFFILMMLGFYKMSKDTNTDAWYEKIKQTYITNNAVKWSLSAIGYNIMKNSFIVYFLLGLPIMIILTDLVFIYNITAIALYMQVLLYLYIALIMVLGVVFLGFVQEWFMDATKMLEENSWGVDNEQ